LPCRGWWKWKSPTTTTFAQWHGSSSASWYFESRVAKSDQSFLGRNCEFV
jgi:hypothetical protein